MSLGLGEYLTLGILAASGVVAVGGLLQRFGVANHNDRLERIGAAVQTGGAYVYDTLTSLSAHVPNLDVAATRQALISNEITSVIEHNKESVIKTGNTPDVLEKKLIGVVSTLAANAGTQAAKVVPPTSAQLALAKGVGGAAITMLEANKSLPATF